MRFPWLPGRRGAAGGKGDALDRVPLLALLEPDLRKRVRKRLRRRRVAAEKPLFRKSEPADALFLIGSGRFRVLIGDRPSDERVLRFVGAGDVLGEAAFMAESPHNTTAVAVEDASVWMLARADFDALLGRHEGVLRYLATVIAERQSQANARLAAESAPEEARAARGYVSAFYSPRGGAGVTTLAVNVALALAERHPDDTVLLDLDVLFGHALANLWLEPRGVLAQVTPVTLRNLDRGGLDYYLLRHPSSLRIFPAATRPEEGQAITSEHIRAALAALRRWFGHVVLDLPHGFNDVTLSALESADRVLVVATPETAILQDILESRRILTEVLTIAPDRLTYVMNYPQPYTAASVADFSAATDTPWLEVAHGGEAPATAALRGESMLTSKPNNPVSRAALALAEQLSREASEQASLSGAHPN